MGDTIQVGYGNVPNAILSSLRDKKHLGIHTDLLSDGLLELMNSGVVDNSRKTINRGKTIASYCMGSQSSYENQGRGNHEGWTFFPGEWYPQSGVQLTWPHRETDWKDNLEEVTGCYIALSKEILKREKLLVACQDAREVAAYFTAGRAGEPASARGPE